MTQRITQNAPQTAQRFTTTYTLVSTATNSVTLLGNSWVILGQSWAILGARNPYPQKVFDRVFEGSYSVFINKPIGANNMTDQFIIWGIPPQGDMETLLVSEHAGLNTRADAERAAALLTDKHGCSSVRIHRIEPFGDAREVAAMFRAAVA
jgi:hypothetical protein